MAWDQLDHSSPILTLKKYASATRRTLLREVRARLAQVCLEGVDVVRSSYHAYRSATALSRKFTPSSETI